MALRASISGLKVQLDTAQEVLAVMKQRCDAVEGRAATAEQRAPPLERESAQAAAHAATADQLSSKRHDMVVSAFGVGSRAHLGLEAVVMQAAAE